MAMPTKVFLFQSSLRFFEPHTLHEHLFLSLARTFPLSGTNPVSVLYIVLDHNYCQNRLACFSCSQRTKGSENRPSFLRRNLNQQHKWNRIVQVAICLSRFTHTHIPYQYFKRTHTLSLILTHKHTHSLSFSRTHSHTLASPIEICPFSVRSHFWLIEQERKMWFPMKERKKIQTKVKKKLELDFLPDFN